MRSSSEWETHGTDEPDTREADGTASGSPVRAGYVPWSHPEARAPSSSPLEQAPEDPQPFNPRYQLQTGITDWINVRALGARGDGVADDTGIFQAANLIAQQPPGRMIYIPAGTYLLSQNIVFSSGVQWLNMGTQTGGFGLSGGTQLSFGGGGSGFANPMTQQGDLIEGGTAGIPTPLHVGAQGQFLTVGPGSALQWGQGPLVSTGDLLVGQLGGDPARLPIGSNGQILGVSGGAVGWVSGGSGGFANPMTTAGDLITGGTAGAAQRLGIGGAGQVLGVSSGAPVWVNNPAGFANPMTTAGDLITGGAAGAAQRLAAGAQGSRFHVGASGPYWQAANFANVLDFGADPTGVADSTAAFNAAYNSLPISGSPGIGGVVYAPAGAYKITTALVFNAVAPVYLVGDGLGATILYFNNNTNYAACVRQFDNYVPSGGATSIKVWGGGVRDLTIDGTNATGTGACGLHIGDAKRKQWTRVQVQNFSGPSQVGVWIDNTKFWTEDNIGDFGLLNNTQAVVFDVNSSYSGSASGTGTSAIDNNYWTFNTGGAGTGQNGVLVTGGAFVYHSRIWLHGGLRSSSSTHTNWAALQVGSNFSANDGSAIYHCYLDIQMESDGGAANTPITILLAHSGNAIHGCFGYMDFMDNFAPSVTPGQFEFDGFINGDTTLIASSLSGAPGSGGTKTNGGVPVLVSVTGGVGVNIQIDGTSTGQSSGMFLLNPGHSFGLGSYSGSPTVKYIPIMSGD